MLNYLDLQHVGPAPALRLDFGPRLNLLTGDNSLGKTFVLDLAWWALTQSWPGKAQDEKKNMAWPLAGHRREAVVAFSYDAKTRFDEYESHFDPEKEQWPLRRGRPGNPGLVLYLRIDGGFSLWDPARNYWKKIEARDYEDSQRPKSFDFDMEDIWNGLRANGNVFCEGLLSDWKTWKDRKGEEYRLLREVLEGLSSPEEKPMAPGEFARLSVADVREIPTIRTPYGDVPVTVASAGMKRALALAYLITWAHTEHLKACKLVGDSPTDRFTVLIDEVELHLHPQWQRTILPAVLGVIQHLGVEGAVSRDGIFPQIQIIASTHAPLVMASIEADYCAGLDKVFHFTIEDGQVEVAEVPWAAQGDAVGWLVSEVFGLGQARSREAEVAIGAAEAFMRGEAAASPEGLRTKEEIDQSLRKCVPGHDAFWARWVVDTGKPEWSA